MDNKILYSDPESDPITNPNASKKINLSEEVSLGEIYGNAVSITSEPIITGSNILGDDIDFQSELPPMADIDGAAAGSPSSGFSQISVTICIDGTPTTGTILFKSS